VIGEDDLLLREGVARVLAVAGFEVWVGPVTPTISFARGWPTGPTGSWPTSTCRPVNGEDDGRVAALEVWRQQPQTSVLVLSQYYEERYAAELLADGADGVGYLLEECVGMVEQFADAATRVAEGGSAVDPEVVARMLGRRRKMRGIAKLSPRELEVTAAMAEASRIEASPRRW
jgi:hypothetical protein